MMQEAIGEGRYETGPLVIGPNCGTDPDWPGVFIRGDEALSWARDIRRAMANPDLRAVLALKGSRLDSLLTLLESCKV